MQNNNNKPANSARKSRGPSRQNGKKPKAPKGPKAPRNRQVARDMKMGVHRGMIEKEELITLVNGSVAFAVAGFPVQPANSTSFPIGSAEATKWTEWRAKYIEVEYMPTVSEFATQGQAGEIAIGVDYNAANITPTAMNQIEALHFAGGGIPSKGFKLRLDCDLINKADPKYIRSGSLPFGDDIRLYDGGNIWFASSGCTNGTQVGKLLVRYHFELRLPTLLNQGGVGANAIVAWFQSAADEASGATTVATNMLYATASQNPMAIVNTAGSFVPPAGVYVVMPKVRVATTAIPATMSSKLDILKNAVSVLTVAQTVTTTTGGGGAYAFHNAADAIISCNGTDAVTIKVTNTFASGTTTQSGGVLFQQIA